MEGKGWRSADEGMSKGCLGVTPLVSPDRALWVSDSLVPREREKETCVALLTLSLSDKPVPCVKYHGEGAGAPEVCLISFPFIDKRRPKRLSKQRYCRSHWAGLSTNLA